MAEFWPIQPAVDHTHNVGVEGLDVDVADGAAGEGPHLCFVFEGSSDLKEEVQQ